MNMLIKFITTNQNSIAMANTEKILEKTIGYAGRMIAGSKSGYCNAYPTNFPVFNSNLVVIKDGKPTKVWHGDLDLTLDYDKLLKASEKLGTALYVLYEMDGRFENDEKPVMDRYIAKYDASAAQNLQVELGVYSEYIEIELNVIKCKNFKS